MSDLLSQSSQWAINQSYVVLVVVVAPPPAGPGCVWMILFPVGLWPACVGVWAGDDAVWDIRWNEGWRSEWISEREEGGSRQTKLQYQGRAGIIPTSADLASALGCHHTTTPPLLHSETLECWIFCIPQDHWSCQSLLYAGACSVSPVWAVHLYTCTPVQPLYGSGLWRPFYSRPEHNIAFPLHHHHHHLSPTPDHHQHHPGHCVKMIVSLITTI